MPQRKRMNNSAMLLMVDSYTTVQMMLLQPQPVAAAWQMQTVHLITHPSKQHPKPLTPLPAAQHCKAAAQQSPAGMPLRRLPFQWPPWLLTAVGLLPTPQECQTSRQPSALC